MIPGIWEANVSDATAAVARRGRRGKDELLLDELIFRQDLNEVQILIDFLSGRNNRFLQSLSMPNPTIRAKLMTASEISESITKMRYPPDGTPNLNSRNAASPRRRI